MASPLEKEEPEMPEIEDEESITIRQYFENFMISDYGRALENFVTIISLWCFFMYVLITYYPDELSGWYYTDYAVGSLYTIEWLLKLLSEQHKWKYMRKAPSLVDFLTALPLFFGDPFNMYVSIARVMRVLRVSRMANRFLKFGDQSEVRRQISHIILTVLTIIVISSGIVMILENRNHELLEPYQFHDMIYFVIVTLGTVGYGDISPQTDPGRACVIILITLVLILLPKQTNELISLMSMQGVYKRKSYKIKDVQHVIVNGTVQVQALSNFCEELFHPDHRTSDKNLVILQDEDTTPEMEIFLRNSKFELFLTYLEGTPMIDNHLKRASLLDAKMCFLLTNKQATDPYVVDRKNIMFALALKKYSLKHTGENKRLCIQLIKPDSASHFYSCLPVQSNDQIIIVEEIKMSMLAKSCFCPGLIAMISNIVRSAGDPPDEGKVKWLYEYQNGIGHEIYRTDLSIKFMGKTFSEVANIIYNECNALLFSLELNVAGQTIIRLNPGKYVIPDTVENNIKAYVICEDKKIADQISTWEMTPEEIVKQQAQIAREKAQIDADEDDLVDDSDESSGDENEEEIADVA